MQVYKEEWMPGWRLLPIEMMPSKRGRKQTQNPKTQKVQTGSLHSCLLQMCWNRHEKLEKRDDGEKIRWGKWREEGGKEKSKEGDEDSANDGSEQEPTMTKKEKRKMTPSIQTLKTEMILVRTVMATWVKQPLIHEIFQKGFYISVSEYLSILDLFLSW